jgi:hypothetical protein
MIDGIINYQMFVRFNRTIDANLMFHTSTHQRLFNVLLVDLLSMPSQRHFGLQKIPANVNGADSTFLYYLNIIGERPQLNKAGSAIKAPTEEFATWLDADCSVEKVWLPTIEIETTIRLPRISFIKMCGNIAKHSFPRLSSVACQLKEILTNQGHEIDIEQAYLAIPDFYEWFDGIFSYHSSAIGEFLNNIRWGIHDYLEPEYSRSYMKLDPASQRDEDVYPSGCNSDISRTMYWQLMNWVRSTPYMPRFEVTKYLKMRY